VKEAFLRDQFRLQTLDWARVNPRGDFAIIEIDGQAAGRFYVDRRADEIRVVDIALLPPFRGRGVGSALLRRAQEEAIRLRLPIRMHVERNNPARALYGRLGFRVIEDRGVYLFIEWRPETLETRPDAS
jgi:ribosomal protein S18 acetylase RimI-like enzyme